MFPTLGVLITYHNEGALLSACIDSLLSGNVFPNEILIYDDASELPAASYVPSNTLIKVFRGEVNQGGPTYGRKLLLSQTKCEYIHFHDAEDLFFPNWCEKISLLIQNGPHQPDIVVTNCVLQTQPGQQPALFYPLRSLEHVTDLIWFFLDRTSCTLVISFRRELSERIGGYFVHDLRAGLDHYFNIRLATQASSFAFIEDPLVMANVSANSLTRNERRESKPSHLIEVVRALEYLASELPDKYQNLISDKIILIACYLYEVGEKSLASSSFRRALAIGNPTYSSFSPLRRNLSRYIGPAYAETLLTVYRSVVLSPKRSIKYALRLLLPPIILAAINNTRSKGKRRLLRQLIPAIVVKLALKISNKRFSSHD